MEGSTLLLYIGMSFALLVIIYLGLLYFYGKPGPKDLAPSTVSLNTNTNLMSSSEAGLFTSGAGGTLCALVNVDIGNRTASMNMSSFSMLLGIKNGIELQLAPASANQTSTARLLIATTNGPEAINLPPFPLQKWTFVSILREGRRFDVMYDTQIVASHRLEAYQTPTISPISIGSANLIGNAVHVIVASERLTPQAIATLRAQYSDTTGAPPPPSPFVFPFELPSFMSFCIPGLPCDSITAPPANRMKSWSSLYN